MKLEQLCTNVADLRSLGSLRGTTGKPVTRWLLPESREQIVELLELPRQFSRVVQFRRYVHQFFPDNTNRLSQFAALQWSGEWNNPNLGYRNVVVAKIDQFAREIHVYPRENPVSWSAVVVLARKLVPTYVNIQST